MECGVKDILFLNLRGSTFEIEKHLLLKLPPTSNFWTEIQEKTTKVFCNINNTTTDSVPCSIPCKEGVIYFNRNPTIFHCILDYFANQELHLPYSMCLSLAQKEFQYWGFDESHLATCCLDRVLEHREDTKTSAEVSKLWEQKDSQGMEKQETSKENNSGSNTFDATLHSQLKVTVEISDFKSKVNAFLSNPSSSFPAKIWAYFKLLVITWSIFTIMLESEPSMRDPSFDVIRRLTNLTKGEGLYNVYYYNSYSKNWTWFLDLVVAFILSLDLLLRLIVARNRLQFLKSFLTITDFMSLVPSYILLGFIIHTYATDFKYLSKITNVIYVVLSFRLLRLFRLGHIIYQYKSLKILVIALIRSWRAMVILVLLLGVSSCFFGITIFLVELQSADTFLTMFHAQWWALITMTTVGYGDFYPTTEAGFFIAVLCALTGIVIVALATTVIINNFVVTYVHIGKYERLKTYWMEQAAVKQKLLTVVVKFDDNDEQNNNTNKNAKKISAPRRECYT